MATLENIFCALCMIGLCVMVVLAIIGLIFVFVWGIVNTIQEWKEDGK